MSPEYLLPTRAAFQSYKSLGERALSQTSEEALSLSVTSESNSIAVIIQHLHGNMLSRWTDMLSTDGEKEWRDRDAEFEPVRRSRAELMDLWNKGWECLFSSFDALQEEDLPRIILIRSEKHTVVEAIQRQLGHTAYHVGQIVYLAKMFSMGTWQTLSVAKGASKQFNEEMRRRNEGA